MEPEHIRFGGGAAETILHPLVLIWMLIAVALILILPRHKVIVPFLLTFFTIPLPQVIVISSVHFTVQRVIILAGLGRLAFFRSTASERRFAGRFNALDWAVVLWTLSGFVVVSLQWLDAQALVKFLGDLLEGLGGYVVVRFLIPDHSTVRRTIKVLGAICMIQGVCMVSELFTHQNVFGFLGMSPPAIREGHLRAMGVMGSLYGGPFAGVLIPMFLWLWTEPKSKLAACAGVTGASAMAISSHASTSVTALGAGLVGLGFWPLRKKMRLVRWGIVAILVALHLIMKGPVWSLIEHVDLTGGSSGYHRYMLIDTLIRHFSDWWLLGTRDNGSWGWEMWDTCNEFVATAVTGGLLTLILYIMILKRSFAAIGNARNRISGDRNQEWFLWCLGSCLFANVVAQFGINYMVQLLFLLSSLLACISAASLESRRTLVEGRTGDKCLSHAPIPAREQFFQEAV